MMATKADKAKWDKLHADLEKADAAFDDFDSALRAKYGSSYQSSWLSAGHSKKLDALRDRKYKTSDKIFELLVKISPRGERWMSGAPAWWIARKLTWEDATRSADEPLSVVVPGGSGSRDGTVTERHAPARVRSTRATENRTMPRVRETSDAYIQIPVIEKWRQIDGDMDPGTYGGIIARSDGDRIDLREIQPVRDSVGDAEAKDVGFPFWTKEATYDVDDLDPSKKETKSAIESSGLEDALEEMAPPQRALAIAVALMRYGYGYEEGPAGWSKDVVPTVDGPVEWWGGVGGSEYIADEDDEFRREVLGEEDEDDEDDDDDDDDEDDDPEDDDDDVFSDDEMRDGYTISDGREGGYDVSHVGKHFGDFDSIEDAVSEIGVQMKRDNFYPNIYYVNDHGNIDLLDAQGNTIKSRV